MAAKTSRIGAVSKELDLKASVIRFWETEFNLESHRTQKGHRIYTEEDVAMLRRIKQLLHEQGMTIEGARRILQGNNVSPVESAGGGGSQEGDRKFMDEALQELQSIRDLLSSAN